MYRGEFTYCGKWSWQEPCKIHPFSPMSTWSQSVSSPFHSRCPALSSGTKHKFIQQGRLLHILVPFRQPNLSIQYYSWSERWHSANCLHTLFKGRGHLGANPKLGYSGSSLQSWLSLSSANLLKREDFPVYTWSRHGQSFYRGTGFGLFPRMR